LTRDYPVIGALTALGAWLTLAALIAGDWALSRLDPRIRHG
jgi:ABC-type dipeptide/oligopeptide/nickel transport system permease component